MKGLRFPHKPTGRSGAPPMPLRPPLDIQETLKILRFRFRRNVGFRPVIGHGGACFYRIDGRLRAESEILLWALVNLFGSPSRDRAVSTSSKRARRR